MKMKFDFDDILIMPTPISDIESRSEIEILDENGMLPLFTAPMFDVISSANRDEYLKNGINTIMPRKNHYISHDFESTTVTKFLSLSLDQFISYIIETDVLFNDKKYFILIDIANGHMAKLVGAIRKAKKKYGDNLVLMVGNIANPITYGILSDAGADYIRVGIGNGCFTPKMEVITDNGLKKISDIKVGDLVKTHTNTTKRVNEVFEYDRDEEIMVINDIECTKNHEFYVIKKSDKDKVSDDNIHELAKWVCAEELTNDYLLIELD